MWFLSEIVSLKRENQKVFILVPSKRLLDCGKVIHFHLVIGIRQRTWSNSIRDQVEINSWFVRESISFTVVSFCCIKEVGLGLTLVYMFIFLDIYCACMIKNTWQKRLKACLVVKGYSQVLGIDFYKIFSPVIKPPTIRIILTIVLPHAWEVCQLDVKNVFLYGELIELVFMK